MADGSGEPSELKITFERFRTIFDTAHILVVTLAGWAEVVRVTIPELPAGNLLLEPYARKTAPCMAYATYHLLKRNPDALIVASPSDAVIRDQNLFARTVLEACKYVEENDVLMTLGIVPRNADTNYGYIQVKEGRNAHLMGVPLQVKTFTEKPPKDLAEVFVRTGEFFWNSGIFIWKAETIRRQMELYVPEVTELFRGWEEHLEEPEFLEKAYSECPRISLDTGVMEHTDRAWLYPASFGWADIYRL